MDIMTMTTARLTNATAGSRYTKPADTSWRQGRASAWHEIDRPNTSTAQSPQTGP